MQWYLEFTTLKFTKGIRVWERDNIVIIAWQEESVNTVGINLSVRLLF